MNVVCSQQNLAKALGQAARLAPARSELPILSNVLLRAAQGFLTLQTTDLQLSVAAQIPAEVKEEGEITVPAAAILGFVTSIFTENIELALEETQLKILTDKGAANFVTMPAVDYPSFPEKQAEPIFVFKTQELARLIRKVRFAAATDEARPVLTGIFLEVSNDKMTFVSTDGFRLSLAEDSTVKTSSGQESIIIPAAAFGEVEKLLGSAGEEEIRVYLTQDKNQVVFELGSVKLASRLLEAEYPDYNNILPKAFEFKAVLAKPELERAVRTVAVFAEKDAQTLFLNFQDKKITIEAQSSGIGDGREEVAADLSGGELKMAFNVSFLREALEAIDGDELIFEAKDALSPTRWTSPSDQGFFHIIMPIRLEE